jgi:hypothetical protein
MPCPTRQRLADLVTGNLPTSEAATLAAHVEECARCGEEVALLARDAADGVRPPRARTPSPPGARYGWPLWAALGAAVGVVVVVAARPEREPAMLAPAPPPVRFQVRAFARSGGEITELAGRARLAKGDHLRLAVDVDAAGFLYVLSVGPAGKATPLHPARAGGSAAFGPGQRGFLPATTRIVSQEPERLFAIFARAPLEEAALQGVVARDLARAGGLPALTRLSIDAAQWTMLVEKR